MAHITESNNKRQMLHSSRHCATSHSSDGDKNIKRDTMVAVRPAFALSVSSLLLSRSAAGTVTLYKWPSGLNLTRGVHVDSITVNIGPAQRCYALICVGGMITKAEWSGLQKNSFILFFSEPGCDGVYVKLPAGTDNDIQFYNSIMENNVTSVTVWESSVYPTRGARDCVSVQDYERDHIENGGLFGDSIYNLNTTYVSY